MRASMDDTQVLDEQETAEQSQGSESQDELTSLGNAVCHMNDGRGFQALIREASTDGQLAATIWNSLNERGRQALERKIRRNSATSNLADAFLASAQWRGKSVSVTAADVVAAISDPENMLALWQGDPAEFARVTSQQSTSVRRQVRNTLHAGQRNAAAEALENSRKISGEGRGKDIVALGKGALVIAGVGAGIAVAGGVIPVAVVAGGILVSATLLNHFTGTKLKPAMIAVKMGRTVKLAAGAGRRMASRKAGEMREERIDKDLRDIGIVRAPASTGTRDYSA